MELSNKKSVFGGINRNMSSYTMVIGLVGIWLIFSIVTNGLFLSPRNLSQLLRQTSIVALLSLGLAFIIISGNNDLSCGNLLGLCGGISAVLQVWLGQNTIVAVLGAIGLGVICGMWNGYWIAYRKITAFIVTLGNMMIFQGTLLAITKGITIAPMQPDFIFIGQGYVPFTLGLVIAGIVEVIAVWSFINGRRTKIKYGLDAPSLFVTILKCVGITALIIVFVTVMHSYRDIPVPILIALAFALLFYIVATRTRYGRSVYAIGGNREAAQLSGIKDKRVIFTMYVIMGSLAGLGGVILTARMNAATANAGQMMQMDAIASCFIGGISMRGGIGSIPGALVGALVMASVDNGMSLLNLEYYWQYIIKGLIVIIAVWIDLTANQSSTK